MELLDLLVSGTIAKKLLSTEFLKKTKKVFWIVRKKHTVSIAGWQWCNVANAVFQVFTKVEILEAVRRAMLLLGVVMDPDRIAETGRNMEYNIPYYDSLKIFLLVDKLPIGSDDILIPVLRSSVRGDLGSERSRLFTALYINFDVEEYEGFPIHEFLATVGIGLFALYDFVAVPRTMPDNIEQSKQILAAMSYIDIMTA